MNGRSGFLPGGETAPISYGVGVALVWTVLASFVGWVASLLFAHAVQPVSIAVLLTVLVVPPVSLILAERAATGHIWALGSLAFLIVFVSDLTFRVKDVTDGSLDGQSAMKFAIWSSGVLVLLFSKQFSKKIQSRPAVLPLAVFAIWCSLTTFYSESPVYTLAASLAFFGMTVVAIECSERIEPVVALRIFLYAIVLGVFASLILYMYQPSLALAPMEGGRVLRLAGVFGSPNTIGRAAALAMVLAIVLFCYATKYERILIFAIILVPTAAALYLSGSRTALGAAIISLIVYISRAYPIRAAVFFSVVLSVGVAFLAIPGVLEEVAIQISRSGRISEITTLTGRTDIWSWVVEKAWERPVHGFGFASSKVVISSGYFASYGWTTTSAHNMWLQVWITTGAVGLMLMLASQVVWMRQFLVRPYLVRDVPCIFVMTVGLLEASAFGPSVNLLTFVFLWAVAFVPSMGSDADKLSGAKK